MLASYKKSLHAAFMVVFCLALGLHASAQSVGNSGSINGTVVDPTGAVVAKATVEIHNPVSGFDRSTTTDASGKFELHKYSLQSLPPDGHGGRLCRHRAGRGASVGCAGQRCHQTARCRGQPHR